MMPDEHDEHFDQVDWAPGSGESSDEEYDDDEGDAPELEKT
jgi:hypothetical protein